MKLAYAFCGSFCTHSASLEALKGLVADADVTPALSEAVQNTDTRFGSASTLRELVTAICGKAPILTVKSAEEIITRGGFDALIISPCTGNTLAKIANGITDTAVTMCVKAQLRCRRPVIIAPATNDGLGANLQSIAKTLEKKNVYFVPFGQDDPFAKPTSLICDFSLIRPTLDCALKGIQLQPILL
jgi:dipicolinate synthase subunit B